ncbi:cell division protein FtsZ [Elysia marginata]|uniref:Cell division protein FtsZ n=1 Tax=Elysia marginata TaxID=1093978 RepID=A0AAV4FP60_9GAST|nr:cell division protein FtsZ [Elysia marginata]
MFENNKQPNQPDQQVDAVAKIKVIGVGGSGNNTIHSMVKEGIKGVEFIVANTDEQVLNSSIANTILPLGNSAAGLGAGANPEEGKKAALESESIIDETIKGADMVIVAAGMGGGTGTGAAPIIAKQAKDMGALTVGIVTTPFSFEGTQRNKNAEIGLENMMQSVDSLIVVSNDKLLEQFGGISLKDSFMYADKVLKQTVRTITDLIAVPALINLDFADVTTVMKDKGNALIGIGRANGEDRAQKAAIHAISSPILEASIKGATHAIINISGGDITLAEASKAVDTIKQAAGSDLNIIFGVSVVESLANDIQVSVIATGLDKDKQDNYEDIKDSVAKAVETMEIDFENDQTRELLVKDPLPEEEKLHITDEIELQNSPFDVSDDDEDELPAFLRK